MPPEPSLLTGTDDLDRVPGYPFRGPRLLTRAAPFAAIAALAEASLALTPNPPAAAVTVSLVLLLMVAAAFALPWERQPDWLSVLMPLAYTGSVLALILAAGSTSGVGVVILVPLLWTALYQHRWESGCVLAAVIVVEVIISLTPVAAPGGVTARRVVLWAVLGAVIAVATHELRDRSSRDRKEAARLHDKLTELTLVQDRDRIAADLQDKIIQQVFAVGLSLQSTATLVTQPEMRRRILASADELDLVLRQTRDAVFGLENQLQGSGLRAEIAALCEEVSPAPEISFTGPVDGALHPVRAMQLRQTLEGALAAITSQSALSRIAVVASESACTAEIETVGTLPVPNLSTAWLTRLQDDATGSGIGLAVQQAPGGTRFTWSVPLGTAGGRAGAAELSLVGPGHLLGDAVNVAAAEQDLPGRHPDHLALRVAARQDVAGDQVGALVEQREDNP